MKLLFQLLTVGSVLLLSGCGGGVIQDWAEKTFEQGKTYAGQDLKKVSKYIRSVRIYDQFTTVAVFDALWLSDEVRTVYSDKYAAMHGRTDQIRNTFLRRQLKSNQLSVTFYVLSVLEVPLNIKTPQWALYLEINGVSYAPVEIKVVELSPEYEWMFGKKLGKHKRPYEVRFDRKNIEGRDILEGSTTMRLHFNGLERHTSMEWPIGKQIDMNSPDNAAD